MALDPRGAALALHRFGFGPRPGSIAAIATDPTAALVADLDRPNAGEISSAGLLSSGAINRATVQFNAERTAKERLEARRREEAKAAAQAGEMAGQMAGEAGAMEAVKTPNPQLPQPETPMATNLFAEARTHFETALRAETGYVERLVWFWANHFCVNIDATVMYGAYVREAIRPHVLAGFADLVLADLARHPATAKHIAVKLARHFIADDPPPALVETLTRTFLETDGDLWKVSKALVTAPEAMAPERAKIKRPGEWVMSYLRAEGFNIIDPRTLVPTLNRLGEPPGRPPSPKGFPDDNGAWLENLSHRLDTANAFAQNNAERVDPKDLLAIALWPLASAETRQAVARAESKPQALTLLLIAPEFQRR